MESDVLAGNDRDEISDVRRMDEFARAYGDYARCIYAYLLRKTCSPHMAEDLMQEAFLKAWRKRDTFGGLSSLKTWLFAIACNVYRDYARKAGREISGYGEWVALVSDSHPRAGEALARAETVERLKAAMAALPEKLRAPLMLVRFDGLRYREAGEVLGISADTVRMRLHRAHRLLSATFAGTDKSK